MQGDFTIGRLLHLVRLLNTRTDRGSIEWKPTPRMNPFGSKAFRTSTPSSSLTLSFNGRRHNIRIMDENGSIVAEYSTGSDSPESHELDSELERLYDLVHVETSRVNESIERVIRELEGGL
ncbi:hypothetical protein TPA0907_52930 [Micromonospora humidisoli]|nr:hypothetical protein TPA0907_52930 [Micromonospora sp. AKA109]